MSFGRDRMIVNCGPPPFNNNLFCKADKIAVPISKPGIDLADAFPILLFSEMTIVGLLNLSFIREAIIPITPSCQFSPVKTKTGSLLNDATKKEIQQDLRKYAMASIDPVIMDPDDIYIYRNCLHCTILVADLILLRLRPISTMVLGTGQHKRKLITLTLHLEQLILRKR